MKRILIWSILGIVVVAAVYVLLVGGGGNSRYEFRFDAVSQGDINVYITATGTINPVVTVDVGTQVSGIISKLYADFNSIVREGQLIAQIDTTFLVQSVKEAEASLERAGAQYADSKRAFERTKALFDKGLESQANRDAALTAFETNGAAMKSARASLDRARINLSYAKIYAPVNGVVIDRKVNVGQTVAASFSSPTLYTIANDLKNMQVQTTVDESDIGRVSIGQTAEFTVDAYAEEKFAGTVSQIRLAPINVQNVINYTVIIDVDNGDLKLLPGMTANVKILVGRKLNVMRVANLALRFQPPGDMVDSSKVRSLEAPPNGDSHAPGGPMMALRGRGGPDGRARIAQPADSAAPLRRKPASDTRFGVMQSFPEYHKSSYDVTREAGFGRIWILTDRGRFEPRYVRTGLSDGRYTEVVSNELKQGDKIVLGVASDNEATAEPQRNPLTPQQRRGGFR